MKKRQFVLVVLDRDTGEFTVEGPMSDDRLWNSAVVNAQRVGRNIRCFSMGDIAPGCRCNRMALVLRGSPDWVWLDSVGLSPRGTLTKGAGSSSTVDLPASTRKFAQSRQHPAVL